MLVDLIRRGFILSVDISVKVFFSIKVDFEHPLSSPVSFFLQINPPRLFVDSKIQAVLLALDSDHDIALAKVNWLDFYVC